MYGADRRWAFKRFKIRTKDSRLIPLVPNYAQERFLQIVEGQEAAGVPVRIIAVKPRKVGISTLIQAILYQRCSSKPLTKGLTVAHKYESSQEMFTMTALMHNELPPQLRVMTRFSSRSEIVFENPDDASRSSKPGLRSQLTIDTAGNPDLGRSQDIHLLQMSESPIWPNPEETELSVLNAIPSIPGTMVFKESTPRGVGNKFHRDYLDAKAGRSAFAPYFIAWWEFPDYKLPLTVSPEEFEDSLDTDERLERAAYNLTLEQLNWRRWCIDNNCGRDKFKFQQEYPSNDVDGFLVSGRPKFDPMILKRMLTECYDPVGIGNLREDGSRVCMDEHSRGFVKMWKPPKLGGRYVIGGDVAEGLEHGDYSVGHVWDWDENEMVAEWYGHCDPDSFGKELCKLGKIYNDALIGCEVNKDGGTVNTRMYNDGYPYIYYRQDLDRRTNRKTARRGWLTSSTTKPLMVNSMITALRDGVGIPSRETIGEFMTFVIHDDGSMGGQSGTHDDRVIASCIAQEVRKRQGIDRYLPALGEIERESENV